MEILSCSYFRKHQVIYKWKIDEIIPFIEPTESCDEGIVTLDSPNFTTSGKNKISWYLKLLLREKGWISILLCRKDENDEVKIKVSVFMLDSKNERKFIQTNDEHRDFEEVGKFLKFLEIQQLLKNKDDFLPNNTLTVGVKLSIYDNYESFTFEYPLQTPQRQMTDDFKKLYNSQINSDVTFIVGNEKFKAHKIILSARSPVFSAMFTHKMKENRDSKVAIPDIEPKIFSKLLEFIYTDEINDLNMDAVSLLEAADKYQLLTLKSLCEKSLSESVSIDNAIALMILADLHNANQLFERVLELIIKNIEDVIDTPEYKILEESKPLLLSELFKKLATSIKNDASKDEKKIGILFTK